MEKGTQSVKVTLIFFVYFTIFSFISQGQAQQRCIAYPDTIKMVQERKYVLKCFIKGDEYSSITTTVDGYPSIGLTQTFSDNTLMSLKRIYNILRL